MFCQNCGNEALMGVAFCAGCSTSMADPPIGRNSPIASPHHSGPQDISLGMLFVNFIGMLFIAFLTYPIQEELKGSSAIIYLLIRVAVPAFFAAVATGLFYIFRKKKEGRLLKRSFVIASWVFLGLVIFGEQGSNQPSQTPSAISQQAEQVSVLPPETSPWPVSAPAELVQDYVQAAPAQRQPSVPIVMDTAATSAPAVDSLPIVSEARRDRCQAQYQNAIDQVDQNASLGDFAEANTRASRKLQSCLYR